MKKLILIPCLLAALVFGACSEPQPVYVKKKTATTTKVKKSDNAEDFRTIEKPSTYTR